MFQLCFVISLFFTTILAIPLQASASFFKLQDEISISEPLDPNSSRLIDEYMEPLTVHHFMKDAKKNSTGGFNHPDFNLRLLSLQSEYLRSDDFQLPSVSVLTSRQKLANIIVELVTWAHIRDQVAAQVRVVFGSKMGEVIWNEVWNQIGAEIRSKLRERLRTKLNHRVDSKVTNQIEALVNDQIESMLSKQVKAQLRGEVKDNLQHFLSKVVSKDHSTAKHLKSAIIYTIAVNQLAWITMRKSVAFDQITNKLSKFLSENLTEKQINKVLRKIKILKSKEPLVTNHLRLIRRYK